ncbi:MAG: hypothetical protein ACLU18_14895 [Bacteroides thetaiotaomicron]
MVRREKIPAPAVPIEPLYGDNKKPTAAQLKMST